MRPERFFAVIILCLCFFHAGLLQARSIYQRQLPRGEVEVEFNSYYASLGYYLPLTEKSIPCLEEERELEIYRHLLLSPVPRFLVLELSVNPLPCLGVYLKKEHPGIYDRAYVTPHFNLIQAVTAGFEEPYAVSVFLGNVVSFRPPGAQESVGKGYIGLLLSGGGYHIKDSELIDDTWIEGELKIKGDRLTAATKMTWSCRIGAKLHDNADIKDVMYFSLRRDRIDYNDSSLSLLRNSGIEYTFDADKDTGRILRHYFRIGKKLPLKSMKVAASVNTGFIWEGDDRYTGALRRTGRDGSFQILLQPNIEF